MVQRLMALEPSFKNRKPEGIQARPCKAFAKMLLDAKFIAHLTACESCKAVVAYLSRESDAILDSVRVSQAKENVTVMDSLHYRSYRTCLHVSAHRDGNP